MWQSVSPAGGPSSPPAVPGVRCIFWPSPRPRTGTWARLKVEGGMRSMANTLFTSALKTKAVPSMAVVWTGLPMAQEPQGHVELRACA